jgi:transcriptional regulator with XRE-family HTH domain
VSARKLLAQNMIQKRRALGWSQEVLAFESGLHRTFIAQLESMKRNVSLDNVERIACALNVPIRDLFLSVEA